MVALFGLGLFPTPSSAQIFDIVLPPEPVAAGPSTEPLSDASEVVATFGDAAGNTLFVIKYTKNNGQDHPYDLWIMVDGRGRRLAEKFFFPRESDYPAEVLKFSRKRILARVDSGNGVFIDAFRPDGVEFVREGSMLANEAGFEGGEAYSLLSYTAQKPPRRFFDAVLKRGDKVARIRRFNANQLQLTPQP